MTISKDDFACYLLCHASNADLAVHHTELKLLVTKFGSERVFKIQKIYANQTKFQRQMFIKKHGRTYLKELEQKESLVHNLISMYYTDGEFHILEKNQILNLRSIL